MEDRFNLREYIEEDKISDNEEIKKLVDEFRAATDPDNEYYGWEGRSPKEIVDEIRQRFGDTIADQVGNGSYDMHFPRNNDGGSDKLDLKQRYDYHSPRITKQGKMHKQDIDKMKSFYKRGY